MLPDITQRYYREYVAPVEIHTCGLCGELLKTEDEIDLGEHRACRNEKKCACCGEWFHEDELSQCFETKYPLWLCKECGNETIAQSKEKEAKHVELPSAS